MTLLKSQNGWPASDNRAEIHVNNYAIPGTDRYIACSALVAPILVAFIAEFHKLIEPIDEGKWDEWGYAFRPVRGTTDTFSNHASGCAADLNSSRHPLGKKDTFTNEQEHALFALCKKYAIRWGGQYVNRVDEMHFEVVENPTQVKARIANMKLPIPKLHK